MIYSDMSDFEVDESRRQFEAEFRKVYGTDPNIDLLLEQYNHGTDEDPDIGYYSLAARDAWQWWQASRQAIEIETPPRINEIHLRQPKEVEDMWLHRLKFAVESAGLKIKEVP